MALIANILLGIPLLIWGRKLFWLFVGAAGFIGGYWLATRFVDTGQEWILLLIGAGLGVLGIMLTLVVKKFTLTLAGFAAGAYLVYLLIDFAHLSLAGWDWLAIVAGGVLGSLLIISMFDFALILLSSLIGGSLITGITPQGFLLQSIPQLVIFTVLVLIGIILQSAQKHRDAIN